MFFRIPVAACLFILAGSLTAQEQPLARKVVGVEAYGQGIWYSLRLSYRFHERGMINTGYSYTDIPAVQTNGQTASFHIIPVSLSVFWQLPFTALPINAEILFGGNITIGSIRTERSGVRATATGQAFTPVVGFGFAWLPREGGITMRFTCYFFQGIDAQGIESRRMPWLGGSIGYAF